MWPKTRIILRGDSGFANDVLMAWCEANGVDYVFGLARNSRLETALEPQLKVAKLLHSGSGTRARVYRDFRYQTLDSWSRERRVVGKAEHNCDGANPRFVVTTLPRRRYDAQSLYEKLYCARGEAENRIGEQFELFADRASSATIAANQLRMWFSAFAYSARYRASRRPAQNLLRRRRRRDHPPETAQARRSRAHQRAPRPLRHRHKLPRQGRVRLRLRQPPARLQLRLTCASFSKNRARLGCAIGAARRRARLRTRFTRGARRQDSPSANRTLSALRPGPPRVGCRAKSDRNEVLGHFEQGMYEKSRLSQRFDQDEL